MVFPPVLWTEVNVCAAEPVSLMPYRLIKMGVSDVQISIASYTFHGLHESGMMDVFGYLESVKYRYHLDVADIWNGMLSNVEPSYIEKLRASMDEKELTLANLCCDWCQAWDADPELRMKNRENARAHLKAAAMLGAQTVRIDFGGRDETMTPQQFDWTVECFNEYAAFARDNGFLVGPENHYGPARVLKNQLDVMQAVNNDAYGILLHFGNWATEPESCDEAIVPHVMHTHIDARHCAGDLRTTLTPLIESGYKGIYSAEHHSAVNEHAEIALQLAQLKRVLVTAGVK